MLHTDMYGGASPISKNFGRQRHVTRIARHDHLAMAQDESQMESIRVTSRDPAPPAEERPQSNAKTNDGKTDKDDKSRELSEEDEQLKSELEMLVERLADANSPNLHRPALESMRTLIRTSTSSMTSVPKPLKFLRPHFSQLKEIYAQWPDSSNDKALFAEILSVLGMTYSDNGQRETLHFRLAAEKLATRPEEPGVWGHEYVRHLTAEIGDEYNARSEKDEPTDDLLSLALQIVEFSMAHNGEIDAIDLLLELEAVDQLPRFVEKDTYERVCLYLLSCVNLLVPPDDVQFLRTAHEIYRKHHRYYEALVVALRIADPELVRADFTAPSNPNMRKQMAFLLWRQQVPPSWIMDESNPLDQELLDCFYGTYVSRHFIDFGKELGVADPRSTEDIYKSHLDNTRVSITTAVDSARGNLANVFVNAFVNAGFGNDPLIVGAEEGSSYVYKTKDSGMFSAAASTGLSLLWDTEMGLSHIDKYTYSSEENVKAGAMLAYGISHAGVRTEMDAPLALLSEHIESNSQLMQTAAIVGLGIAYAGTCREEVLALLLPLVQDETTSIEVASLSTLSLGFVFSGSAHGEIVPSVLQSMMERDPAQLEDKWSRFMALGLALLFIGQQDNSDATIETLKAIDHPVSKEVQILVDACSYAGTGNVLKIQTLLHYCAEHVSRPTEEQAENAEGTEGEGEQATAAPRDLYQAFSVLSIALIAMGEDVGAEMTLRHMSHLMHYGDPVIRRTVPLALALLNPSNPIVNVLDTLSKYSHDSDLDVAINAIFAMGVVGAGTNNARLAQRLRQLAGYYYKEPNCLFIVRIAQGLVHMGKGVLGVDPYHTDRQLFSRPAVSGLLATLLAFTDAKGFVLDRHHWMLFWLSSAIHPRFLITLNEDLSVLPVTVRVGKAVDTVGQAGKPRTISGFQTHTTPVRLGSHERGVLATGEYLPYATILEGFVLLHKNPNSEE